MRSIINKLLLGTMTVASVACTGNYLDINSNPYQPGDLSADDYALGSAMNNLASCVVSSDVNTAQFTDCLLGGPYGGYFADSNTSWSKTIANFNASDDWTRVFLKSDRIIPILYTNLTAVENLATQTGNQVPLAIAKIIKVAAMSRVTDAYGPIPYTEIGKDGSITTPYDSQEKVYDTFFQELTEAVEVLQANPEAALTATADYVYSSDGEGTEFNTYLQAELDKQLAYSASFDGVIVEFIGQDPTFMNTDEKEAYAATQNIVLNAVKSWKSANENKMLTWQGKPQNLIDKTILNDCSHIILDIDKVTDTNQLLLTVKSALADGVPTDNIVIAVSTTGADTSDKKTGYWDTDVRALGEVAHWVAAGYPEADGFTRAGIAIYNVQNDYYATGGTYTYVKEAINILNPAPTK